MAAGYSTKPLVEKLGIKAGTRVLFLNAPAHYVKLLGPLPEHISLVKRAQRPVDFIHFFTTSSEELGDRFGTLAASVAPGGMLWISWPKMAAKVSTDLNENVVRAIGLEHGFVDVKVCAIDETWSGLKFLRRKPPK